MEDPSGCRAPCATGDKVGGDKRHAADGGQMRRLIGKIGRNPVLGQVRFDHIYGEMRARVE